MSRLRYAAALYVAATILSGCGGSQLPIGDAGAVAQGRANLQKAAHNKSWMLPEAKSKDLLYVADSFCCLRVFSFPKGKPVGVLKNVSPSL